MRVTVRLFARLRDIAGAAEMPREIPPGSTIRTVWAQLAGEFPDMAAYERSMSSALNADYARMDALLAYLTENCCAGSAACGPAQACKPRRKGT